MIQIKSLDINCGVRLLRTDLTAKDVQPKINELVRELFHSVPSGVGSKGKLRLQVNELGKAVTEGVGWAVRNGYGREEDKERCEENGNMEGANFDYVSDIAKKRGLPQFGTLGAGNHFLEVQKVDEVLDEETAKKFGIFKDQITVMIHCGSRGFGHQVCDDYIRKMLDASRKYKIALPDKELCCAPVNSPEAKRYIGAMKCAVNYAFNNRHIIAHWVREVFGRLFGKEIEEGMHLIYDVCHNIAKYEEHEVDGKKKMLWVHRKGATRAFPPGRKEIPTIYQETGQPVIIPGTMGTASYLLAGTPGGAECFYSTCFPGYVKIITDRGIISIKEIYERIQNGELFSVPSLNKQTLEIEWKPITNSFRLEAEVIRVAISQSGRTKQNFLDLTPDHKMVSLEDSKISEKEISRILKDQEMVLSISSLKPPVDVGFSSQKFAYLLGALLSDGSIYFKGHGKTGNKVTFIQKNCKEKFEFIGRVLSSFEEVFNEELSHEFKKSTLFKIRGKEYTGEADYFMCYKIKPAEKLWMTHKTLEKEILTWDEETILNFIAGLVDGDGTYNVGKWRDVIHIYISDEKVINALVLGSLKVGIQLQISRNRNTCYNVMIRDKIPEIISRTARFRNKTHVVKKKYGNRLFAIRQLLGDQALNVWPFREKYKANKMYCDRTINFYLNKVPEEIRKRVEKIINSNVKMLRAKFADNLGEQEVYNIEVADNHNYFVLTTNLSPILVKNCHGGGRTMSRHQAIKTHSIEGVKGKLSAKGIVLYAASRKVILEEAPDAYKDIDEIVKSVADAGISKIVSRHIPMGVAKG